MDIDDEQDNLLYDVEAIIDSKWFLRKTKYRVR